MERGGGGGNKKCSNRHGNTSQMRPDVAEEAEDRFMRTLRHNLPFRDQYLQTLSKNQGFFSSSKKIKLNGKDLGEELLTYGTSHRNIKSKQKLQNNIHLQECNMKSTFFPSVLYQLYTICFSFRVTVSKHKSVWCAKMKG